MNNSDAHEHCWHPANYTLTVQTWPPSTTQVCCHCGRQEQRPIPVPPPPPGHGRFYPQPYGGVGTTWFTKTAVDPTANCACRPENGGSGLCGCVRPNHTTL